MARLRNETCSVLNAESLGLTIGPFEEFDAAEDADGKPVHVPGCVPVDVPAGPPPDDPPAAAKAAKPKAGKAGEDTP